MRCESKLRFEKVSTFGIALDRHGETAIAVTQLYAKTTADIFNATSALVLRRRWSVQPLWVVRRPPTIGCAPGTEGITSGFLHT
jgi:hypothetical protein